MFTFLEWHPKRNPILYHMMQKSCVVQTLLCTDLCFWLTELSWGFFSNKGLNVISQTLLSEKTDGEPSHFIKKRRISTYQASLIPLT